VPSFVVDVIASVMWPSMAVPSGDDHTYTARAVNAAAHTSATIASDRFGIVQ
jgi:hypothetical protein